MRLREKGDCRIGLSVERERENMDDKGELLLMLSMKIKDLPVQFVASVSFLCNTMPDANSNLALYPSCCQFIHLN